MIQDESNSRGLQTLAVRDQRFLEMAVDLALSDREVTDLPISLAADEEMAGLARERFAGVFDHVTELSPRFLVGRAAKYGVVEASPFEEGIYVDADALLLHSLDDRWDDCDGMTLGLVGEFHTRDSPKVHHGFSVAELVRRFSLTKYLKCNSGVFYFRRESALEVMEACLTCYLDEVLPKLRGGFLGDELAMGIVGGRQELGIFPGHQPMHWRQELAVLDPDQPLKPVMHLLARVHPDAFRRLMEGIDRRRRTAGLEPTSKSAWLWKQKRLIRADRLRVLEPLLLPVARLLRLGIIRQR